MASGAESWTSIEEFGIKNEDWLKKYFQLSNGIPSNDIFHRVFSQITTNKLEEYFNELIKYLDDIADNEFILVNKKVPENLDNNTVEEKAIDKVYFFQNENQLILGEPKAENKSNEINAIPKLLEILDLKNTIITMDTMAVTQNVFENIFSKEGDYIFLLKKNEKASYDDVKFIFDSLMDGNSNDIEFEKCSSNSTNEGKTEVKEYYLIKDLAMFKDKEKFNGVSSIGMVLTKEIIKDKETKEYSYYITSLNDLNLFSKTLKECLNFNNEFIWKINVCSKDIKERINAEKNLETLKKIVSNLSIQEKCDKKGLNIKNKKKLFISMAIGIALIIDIILGTLYFQKKVEAREVILRQANEYMQKEDYNNAANLFNEYLSYKKDNIIEKRLQLSVRLNISKITYETANRELKKESYEEALTNFEKVIPEDIKRYEDSRKQIEKISKNLEEYYINQAINAYKEGNEKIGDKFADKALNINSENKSIKNLKNKYFASSKNVNSIEKVTNKSIDEKKDNIKTKDSYIEQREEFIELAKNVELVRPNRKGGAIVEKAINKTSMRLRYDLPLKSVYHVAFTLANGGVSDYFVDLETKKIYTCHQSDILEEYKNSIEYLRDNPNAT